jgi:Restriction endonuclease
MSERFRYTYDQLIEPTFNVLKNLGGSASNEEIIDKLIEVLNIPDEQTEVMQNHSQTKLAYRASWARTYLKKAGYLTNSSRGVWQFTTKGDSAEAINSREIVENVKGNIKKLKHTEYTINQDDDDNNDSEKNESRWKDQVLQLINQSSPKRFEELCGHLLRELGFLKVNVEGRPNDGGIDGFGVMKLGEILTFQVAFQAKRYQNPVSSVIVRNFRGSIMGRAEKGIILTTSTFTRDAIRESKRDGAITIDLVDGDLLTDLMKKFDIGIQTEVVERISVDADFFK